MSHTRQKSERYPIVVQSDPEIIAGTPVFRGTRIPVYLIADMVQKGASIQEILERYPSLTGEMAQYAGIYATTHPLRGRPPVPPWSGKRPVGRKKGTLRRST